MKAIYSKEVQGSHNVINEEVLFGSAMSSSSSTSLVAKTILSGKSSSFPPLLFDVKT